MRPLAEYWFELRHPSQPNTITLYAFGNTPCQARNNMWTLFEQKLREERIVPNQGWMLRAQHPAAWHPKPGV